MPAHARSGGPWSPPRRPAGGLADDPRFGPHPRRRCRHNPDVIRAGFFQAEDGIRDIGVTGVQTLCSSDLKIDITTLGGGQAGSVELDDAIFGLEPRADILQRCVRWQLAKRRAGTHAVKNRSDVNRTTKKMYKQKGTGNARHGAASAPQFRGGGRAFGPQVRSHEHDLPKKVRALALKHALSAKARDASLIVVDEVKLADPKTKALKDRSEEHTSE